MSTPGHLWGVTPRWVNIDLATIHVSLPPNPARGRRPGVTAHRTRRLAREPKRDQRTTHVLACTSLRAVLDSDRRLDGITESQLEEELRGLVRSADRPPPKMNARTGRMRFDTVWPRERVAAEVDGHAWIEPGHGSIRIAAARRRSGVRAGCRCATRRGRCSRSLLWWLRISPRCWP
jgi:hypothetical protein